LEGNSAADAADFNLCLLNTLTVMSVGSCGWKMGGFGGLGGLSGWGSGTAHHFTRNQPSARDAPNSR